MKITNYKLHVKLPRLASRATPSKFEGDLLPSHLLPRTSYLIPLFAFCFLLFCGCERYPESQCPCSKIEISKKESIAMCIIPDIVTENSVNTLRIENHTKKDMGYGTIFYIEYFNENNWVQLEFDFGFTLPYFSLHSGEAIEEVMNLYFLVEKYNESKKGKYRYIKELGNYYLYAEFEVK